MRPTALVLTPASVNFFNDVAGARLAEALRGLGWGVRTTTLRDYAGEPADVAFLVSVVELFLGCGDHDRGRRQLDRVRANCPRPVMWLLEPTNTPWFDNAFRLFRECGLTELADNALHPQDAALTADQRPAYRFLFYGLTEREKHEARAACRADDRADRPVPWLFLGYKTPGRCRTALELVRSVDPSGLLYLTDVAPITATGPHIQDEGYQRVLRRSRYQLWRAHHSSFYMEGERFRRSALAGAVPVKIVEEDAPADRAGLPFPYLLARPDELADALRPGAFLETRRRFAADYLAAPSLEAELARLLAPAAARAAA